jgi:hypothetical protein
MRKIIIINIIIFACIANVTNAQEKTSYIGKAGKIEFTVSDKEIYTEFYETDAGKVKNSVKKFTKFNSTSALVETDGLTRKFTESKKKLNNNYR